MFGEHKLKRTYKSWVIWKEPPVLFLNITTNVKTLFSEKIANEPSLNILVLIDGPTYPVNVPSKHAYMGPIYATHMGPIWGVQPGSAWVPYG